MKRRHSTSLTTLALVGITILLLLDVQPAGAASAGNGTCHAVSLPLHSAANHPATLRIAGTLCTPVTWNEAQGGHQVDVLVPGGMYNGLYWDWPQDPELYSYADKTLRAGRATFVYDRLGTGKSSHTVSSNITFAGDVYNLHQIIQWLRTTYPQVNTVGHSLGSVIAVQEAGQYADINRLVVTGLTHGHGIGFLTLPTTIEPALLDSRLSRVIPLLDAGYVTTLPGKRKQLFYSASADPAVIAYDEAHKDAMTLPVATGAITSLTIPPGLNISNKITAPMLVIVGQQDVPFCNIEVDCTTDTGVWAFEAPYYSRAASLTTKTVPNTGHNLTLHPNADSSFLMINQWMTNH